MFVQRHGEAEPETAGEPDEERKLTDAGRAAVGMAAMYMRMRGQDPRCILSAPDARCIETAQIMSDALNRPVQLAPELHRGVKPEAVSRYLKSLAKDGKKALLVGHHDNLPQALADLGGEHGAYELGDVSPMALGEVRKLKMKDDGKWRLKWAYAPPDGVAVPNATAQTSTVAPLRSGPVLAASAKR
jgi:phosphohistidine phosphatase SixA